jgi:hypothetical protein
MKSKNKTKGNIGIKERGEMSKINGGCPITISFCLENVIEGLHADVCITGDGEEKINFVALTLYGEPFFYYDLEGGNEINPDEGGLSARMVATLPKDSNKRVKKNHG